MTRFYLVWLSPIPLFFIGIILCLVSLMFLMALLAAPFSARPGDASFVIFSLIGFPICGYLGIGAVLNASRAIRAWFHAHFGWK